MRSSQFSLCCALLALAGGSACAVNRPAGTPARCTVQGGQLLPAQSGGPEALCADIEAATVKLPAPPTVEVRVLSPSLLAAKVTVAGKTLPEIKMARSDSVLDRSSFQRFAQAIAAAAARQP